MSTSTNVRSSNALHPDAEHRDITGKFQTLELRLNPMTSTEAEDVESL